jgi:hypothetical protein
MDEQMIELGKRAVACRHWKWMPGMIAEGVINEPYRDGQFVVGAVADALSRVVTHPSQGTPLTLHQRKKTSLAWSHILDAVPCLDHPSTLGCVIALARTLHGNPGAYSYMIGSEGWCIGMRRSLFIGPTEAHAWIAALESAP